MSTHFPPWFHALSIASLVIGGLCAASIALDELRRPQRVWIMNLVWPLTAPFGGLLRLAGYLVWGRGLTPGDPKPAHGKETPFPVMVAKGASHCGAGCALGDLVAEWLAFLAPGVAVAFGWKSVFADKMFAVWVLDYLLAFGLGVMFQYFTIKPMRDLSVREGIVRALKADVLSITAWQIGMYGFMAFAQLAWFTGAYGGRAEVDTPEFWFVMQIAMLCGFATSYPVNWLLIRMGVKERM